MGSGVAICVKLIDDHTHGDDGNALVEAVFLQPSALVNPRPRSASWYGELASGGIYPQSDPIGLAGGMSRQMLTLVFFLVIALAIMAAVMFLLGQHVELLATTTVPIGAEPTSDPATTQAIALLEKGTRVDVLSCKDLKHYAVPEVRLPDGRVGYALGGQFELIKTMPSLAFGKPIAFSCP